MTKLYIYGGITIGSILGAYLPVVLFGSDPLGFISIMGGFVGSLLVLWAGYTFMKALDE